MGKTSVFSFIQKLWKKKINFFAAIVTIITAFSLLITETWSIIVLLILLVIFLIILVIILLKALIGLMQRNLEEYDCKSTFIKYETCDGNVIHYEVYRLIQCKVPIMTHFDFKFRWSGSQLPKISSTLQTIKDSEVYFTKSDGEYDCARLKLKKNLYYDQTQMINFHAELDDTDKQSKTTISHGITQDVDIVQFRVVLQYKSEKSNAVIEKQPLNSVSKDWRLHKEVAFNLETKSYEYNLLNPDVGWLYRIRWDR
jgi:hypothetical protein